MTIAAPTLGEQRIILHNVSWHLFELMLDELGETSNARLAYDQGILEIMSPLFPHEHTKRLIEKLIDVLVEELNLPIRSAGALTCKREDLLKGIEPDSCFYIQNEPKVRALETINLDRDPAPDLVLEVDFSSSSLDKEPIYVALGVPEIWRYANGELTIKQLQQGGYTPIESSPTFANLPLTDIPKFLNQSPEIGEVGVIRAFRAWIRGQISR